MSAADRVHYDTQLLPADDAAITRAAALLQAGEVVAIPTETVYGLAANALNGAAVRAIFAAKGRPQDNPLIAHIDDLAMLPLAAGAFPPEAQVLANAFWPGPLTMVLPRAPGLADEVTAGLATVGVRMPAHPVARAVIRAAGVPLAAPSANLSGSPSPTTARHVMADMAGRIPLVLDGGDSPVGVESTVVSLVGPVTVLRPGFVTREDLQAALGREVALAAAVTAPLDAGQQPASPGMKYRHYAPKARVTVVRGSFDDFAAYVAAHAAPGVFALCFAGEEARLAVPAVAYGRQGNPASQAAALFTALRTLDERGAATVYARCPEAEGVGLAVYNRLLRAAAFRVVDV